MCYFEELYAYDHPTCLLNASQRRSAVGVLGNAFLPSRRRTPPARLHSFYFASDPPFSVAAHSPAVLTSSAISGQISFVAAS